MSTPHSKYVEVLGVFAISESDFDEPATRALAQALRSRSLTKWDDPSAEGLMRFGFDSATAGYLSGEPPPASVKQPPRREVERNYAAERARIADLRARGYCARCWKHKVTDGHSECGACRAKRAVTRHISQRFAS